jgi:hypothetical protein
MASIYQKKGKNIWYYCITYNGKKYQGSTKTTDKQSAKLIAEAKQTDIAREYNKIPVLNKNIGNFSTLWQGYLKLQANLDVRKRTAANHFLPVFGNKGLNNISMPNIKNYQFSRKLEIMTLEKNKSKRESEINFRSVNYEMAILRNFFNYCKLHAFTENSKKANTAKYLKMLISVIHPLLWKGH